MQIACWLMDSNKLAKNLMGKSENSVKGYSYISYINIGVLEKP